MGGLKQLSFTKKIALIIVVVVLFFILELFVIFGLVTLTGIKWRSNTLSLLFMGNPALFATAFMLSFTFALVVGVLLGLWLKPKRAVTRATKLEKPRRHLGKKSEFVFKICFYVFVLAIVLGIFYSLLFPPSDPSYADDWVMFGHDASRSGSSEDTVTGYSAKDWEISWSDSMLDSPSVAYGCVYYKLGHVVCYDAFTGETVWEAEREAAGDIWSVAVAYGCVYADSNGYVYALNASTGDEVWTFVIGNNEELYAPAVADGVVYVGCGNNNLYAFDAYDGNKIWNYTTGGKVRSCPAVANGIVYVACNDGNLYAIDASTGTKIWNYTTGRNVQFPFLSSPAVADGVVYVGSTDKSVYALNAVTGSKLWNYTIGGIFSTPAIASDYVYVADANNLYAFNASTGTKLWNFTHLAFSPEYSSPSVADGVVYIGSSGEDSYSGRFYALNAYTGEQIEQIEMSSKVFSTAAVAYGMVYVASAHRLYGMNASRFTGLSSLELASIVIIVITIFVLSLYIYRKKIKK